MKTIHFIFIGAFFLLIGTAGCKKDGDPPVIDILSPAQDESFDLGDTVQVVIQATDPDNDLSEVRLYINITKVYSSNIPPFEYYWPTWEEEPGDKAIKAAAEDNSGNVAIAAISIHLNATKPFVTLDSLENIQSSSITFTYSIPNSGGSEIIRSGICLNTKGKPDTNNIVFSVNTNDTIVNHMIGNLLPLTNYYIRAFACNEKGISYSNEINFQTDVPLPPELQIYAVRDTASTSVHVDWGISDFGESDLSGCGICWSGMPEPDTSDYCLTLNDCHIGNYTSTLYGIDYGSQYYIRAFAINNYDRITYSNELSFSTLEFRPPEVLIYSVSDYSTTWIHVDWGIRDYYGLDIKMCGICWSTSPDPDTSSCLSYDIYWNYNFAGDYTNEIIGLEPGTMYYIRAFAANVQGFNYSDAISFSTPGLIPPEVNIYGIRDTTDIAAIVDWGITDDYGIEILSCGICWSTSPEPTSSDNIITYYNCPTTKEIYEMTGLAPNTKYFVRAFATNIYGINYSDEINFTTLDSIIQGDTTLIDFDGNEYQSIKIGNQLWMAENLRVTHYQDGTEIPNLTDSIEWYNAGNGACCNYDNNSTLANQHGRLYNHYAVMNAKGLCPAGWHIPDDTEWKELEIAAGMAPDQADLYQEWRGTAEGTGSQLQTGGSTGFNATLSGTRGWYAPENFSGLNILGGYWTSSQGIDDPENAIGRGFRNEEPGVQRGEANINRGYSVRCIKDL